MKRPMRSLTITRTAVLFMPVMMFLAFLAFVATPSLETDEVQTPGAEARTAK